MLAGLILDVSIAFSFGAGPKTDAFFVASRIPIGLVAVVMVAANQALVPAFRTSFTKRGEQATDRLISMVLCAVVAVGVALVLLSWLIAVAADAHHRAGHLGGRGQPGRVDGADRVRDGAAGCDGRGACARI